MRGGGRKATVFARLLMAHRWRMGLGCISGLFTIACGVGLMALSGWFISAAASAGLTAATAHLFNFFYPSIGVRLFAFGRTVSRYVERIVSHDATFRILEGLRVWFYRRLEPLAPAGLAGFRSGDMLNRIVSDIDALDNLYLRVLSPSAVAVAAVLLVAAFLLAVDPAIGLSTLGFLCLAGIGVPAAAALAARGAGRQLALRSAELRVLLVDGLQGMAELLVFGAGRRHRRRLLETHRDLVGLQRRMGHIRGACTGLLTLLSGGAAMAALYVGVERVSSGAMAGPCLAMVALAVLASFEAVMGLPAAFQYLSRTREAGRRLQEIVETPPPVMFPEAPAACPRELTVRFEGVDFRYGGGGGLVLDQLDLEIPYGQRLAVLGETGAGKSTLFNLLVRFRDPSCGRISIGGQDIRSLAEGDLRRLIAVVSQQAHIFAATIRENLLLARPDADEQMLRRALAGARLLDFVDGLPDGIDTWVGEAGRLLSGGQAQRLAVSRAILKDAPIWLLDEPSEGLDRDTERSLLETISGQARGRTLVLITHRPALLEKMDRVVIIEAGRVADSGRHEDLMRRNGRYAAAYRDAG